MTGLAKSGKRSQGAARPITTKRDYERALSVSQKMLAQPDRDSAAELRLQALLKELDRYDAVEDDGDDDLSDASLYGGPPRRWSDDGRND